MKRAIISILLILSMCCSLIACSEEPAPCNHEWKKATCTTPPTCTLCQGVSGSVDDKAHVGDEICTLCNKNYKQSLKDYLFANGSQKSDESDDHFYWEKRVDSGIYINNKAFDLYLRYDSKVDCIIAELEYDAYSSNETDISFTLYINFTSYTYEYYYVTLTNKKVDYAMGFIEADSLTSSATSTLPIVSSACSDGYHSEEYFSQQGALCLKELLKEFAGFLNGYGYGGGASSIGIGIEHLGFTNYYSK